MVITSKQNPLIKKFAALSDKKFRKEQGLFLIEGVKPIKEYLLAGGVAESILITQENVREFNQATVVSNEVFKSISFEKTPQGAIAAVKIPANRLLPPKNACLLLDGLQDPGNVGTIIRTANAAGFTEVYAINCADPYSPKAVRASMSGIFFVNVMQGARKEVLKILSGIPLICADMDGEDVFSFSPPEIYCLCIGNEGNGLSVDIITEAKHTVKIPMRATCESLNAAVSAGIAMYALKNNVLRG